MPDHNNITRLPSADNSEILRVLEAVLFAASEPLDIKTLADYVGENHDIQASLQELQNFYASRGVNLVEIAGKWSFRTAEDLSSYLVRTEQVERKLSRAALEMLAIIAYHQPATRAEIEDIRGVSVSKGTLDILMETGWVVVKGRRNALGRPVVYGTTNDFLEHFGLASIADLPGIEELKAAGILGGQLNFEEALEYGNVHEISDSKGQDIDKNTSENKPETPD